MVKLALLIDLICCFSWCDSIWYSQHNLWSIIAKNVWIAYWWFSIAFINPFGAFYILLYVLGAISLQNHPGSLAFWLLIRVSQWGGSSRNLEDEGERFGVFIPYHLALCLGILLAVAVSFYISGFCWGPLFQSSSYRSWVVLLECFTIPCHSLHLPTRLHIVHSLNCLQLYPLSVPSVFSQDSDSAWTQSGLYF